MVKLILVTFSYRFYPSSVLNPLSTPGFQEICPRREVSGRHSAEGHLSRDSDLPVAALIPPTGYRRAVNLPSCPIRRIKKSAKCVDKPEEHRGNAIVALP